MQSSTIQFLEQLKINNNKAWFEANRAAYQFARTDFEQLVATIISEFGKTEPAIAHLQPKDCIYRINRDVRFSNNKAPYKHNLAAAFIAAGKSSGQPGYYVHIEPGGTIIGGGMWMPDAAALKKIRQEIDYNFKEFDSIIGSDDFKAWYATLDSSEKLSREPKGYEKDHPAIEYLKLKSFVALHPIADADLLKPGLADRIVAGFAAIQPLIRFLNRSLED